MKQLLITTALLCGLFIEVFSQVTGNAYLQNQSNHAGIQIVFEAQSLPAITDTIYTNADGSFSKFLQNGSYYISFRKSGYDTVYYADYAVQQVQNNILNLDNVTLNETQLLLYGNIKDTIRGNQTYKLMQNCNVSEQDTLVIEPGVKFNGNGLTLNINGILIATGTSSSKILFTNLNIVANNNLDSLTTAMELENCIFNNATINHTGLKMKYFKLKSGESYNGDYGMTINSDSIDIIDNQFHDFTNQDSTTSLAWGARISANRGEISCNKFSNCVGVGMQIGFGKNLNIHDNYVYDITESADQSMRVGINAIGSSNSIYNNYISNTGTGISSEAAEMYNNTIVNCSNTGFRISGNNVSLKNNLLMNNGNAIQSSANTQLDFEHNLLFNNKQISNSNTAVYGVPFAKNTKGFDVDIYNNVLANPLAINTNIVSFSDNSPIWGAGANGENIGYNPIGTCFENEWYLGKTDTAKVISPDSLYISGIVHQNNSFLINGKIIAYNITAKTAKTVYTDNNGNFKFDSLATGDYVIKAIRNKSDYWGYTNTFYPNTIDSSKATILTLGGSILDIDLYMQLTDSILNLDFNNKIKVSPNPFENELHISLANLSSETMMIELINMYGEIVKQMDINNLKEYMIDTSNLKRGIYVLKYSQNNDVGMLKLTK